MFQFSKLISNCSFKLLISVRNRTYRVSYILQSVQRTDKIYCLTFFPSFWPLRFILSHHESYTHITTNLTTAQQAHERSYDLTFFPYRMLPVNILFVPLRPVCPLTAYQIHFKLVAKVLLMEVGLV